MELAKNTKTGKRELAASASSSCSYVCVFCEEKVNLRSGRKVPPYFAHWPGRGSIECEHYVSNLQTQHAYEQTSILSERKTIELRLVVPPVVSKRRSWYLELVLPSCEHCLATLVLDVGGRQQLIDMRGMSDRRRVTADLSTAPYGIIEYQGQPDPTFVEYTERQCEGLPSKGVAAFRVTEGLGHLGFSRVQQLRLSDTFALLWKESERAIFPEELCASFLPSRDGWSLAFVCLPEEISEQCREWIKLFTRLSIETPTPTIGPVWPFLARKTSVSSSVSTELDVMLVAAKNIPLAHSESGPVIEVVRGGDKKLFAIGIERSPAFFVLTGKGTEEVQISTRASHSAIEHSIAFHPHTTLTLCYPSVDLVFSTSTGSHQIVQLHQEDCANIVERYRAQGLSPEYMSMPLGVSGRLIITGYPEPTEVELYCCENRAPHNRNMWMLSSEFFSLLVSAINDHKCSFSLDFGGFGSMTLGGLQELFLTELACLRLPTDLRTRLVVFLLQLRLAPPKPYRIGDHALVGLFVKSKPELPLIPHYRSLLQEIIDCGFELENIREGFSS
ncbi:hypothetical protein ACFO3I_01975 [Rheinheimera marina]|uniref:Competence protein CoiA-like N-terminal domain-containing protein n=1 Tax=Rheinheimera marina TaxID=1774958 RepID=A0ABV9JJE9_9GAMM